MQCGLVVANLAIVTSGVFGSSVEAGLKVLCLEIKLATLSCGNSFHSTPSLEGGGAAGPE